MEIAFLDPHFLSCYNQKFLIAGEKLEIVIFSSFFSQTNPFLGKFMQTFIFLSLMYRADIRMKSIKVEY